MPASVSWNCDDTHNPSLLNGRIMEGHSLCLIETEGDLEKQLKYTLGKKTTAHL